MRHLLIAIAFLISSQAIGAEMRCRVFKIPFDGKSLQEPILIAEEKSPEFPIGTLKGLTIELPEPLQDISVQMNHFMVGYIEEGLKTGPYRPYVQAYFNPAEGPGAELRDAYFARETTYLGLRGFWDYSEDMCLSFMCELINEPAM